MSQTMQIRSYIDIHSHMLPAVDDGSDSTETSIAMLRISEQEGAKAVILTPHFYYRRNRYQQGELQKRFERLREAVSEARIGLELYLGNEILWFDEAVEAVRDGEALCLAGSRSMLIEFYPDTAYQTIERAVRRVVQAGYLPVLAHYERYRCFHDSREGQERIEEIREQGASLQMNFNSIAGHGGLLSGIFTDQETAWCRREVQNGHVDFFGSDAHNLGKRSPSHEAAAAWLEKHIPEEQLSEMLLENPEAMLSGKRA